MARSVATPGLALPVQALVAVVAGCAQAASLAWPGSGAPLWWLQLASLALLAWLVQPGSVPIPWRRGAVLGGLFATAWLVGTFWWLFISLHTYGGLAAPLAVAAVLALALFLASYYAIALGLYCRLAPTHRALAAIFFGATAARDDKSMRAGKLGRCAIRGPHRGYRPAARPSAPSSASDRDRSGPPSAASP